MFDNDSEFRSAQRTFGITAVIGAVTSIAIVGALVWGAIEIAKMFAH